MFDSAIQVKILSKEIVGKLAKFKVDIVNTFRKTSEKIRRGDDVIWVPVSDLTCRCPKIRIKKTYAILGKEASTSGRRGIPVDWRNVVIRWNEVVGRNLRDLLHQQGKC